MTGPLGENGGITLRRLTIGGRDVPPGTEIDAETARSWSVMNRMALSESGSIRWHSKAIGAAERHIVSRGFGKFDVIIGTVINDAPLTKEEAEALAKEAK